MPLCNGKFHGTSKWNDPLMGTGVHKILVRALIYDELFSSILKRSKPGFVVLFDNIA
jgi:hypothetical protein